MLLHEMTWLNQCIKKSSSARNARETAWQMYSNLILQHMYHPHIPAWVLVTVSRNALQALLDWNFAKSQQEDEATIAISEVDKDIVQYIAGFVIHRIKRKLMILQDSDHKRDELLLISALSRQTDEHETSQLISAKQRGGLMSVRECLVPMFTKLEMIIRKHLKLDGIVQQVSVDTVGSSIFCDDAVLAIYESSLTDVEVPQNVKEKMFSDLVTTYIKTRISGYCRQQIQRMTMRIKAGKKQRSLRTTMK